MKWADSVDLSLSELQRYSSPRFPADGQRLASSSGDMTIKIWDASSGACLQTPDVGRVIIDLSSANAAQLTEASLLDCSHYGYGVSTDGIWIVKDRKRLLRLPPEYQALKSAVAG